MGSREAIGLGVVKRRPAPTGNITTKAKYERCQGNPRAMATGIPRALSHFDWPSSGPGCCIRRRRKGRSARDPDRAVSRLRRGRCFGAAVGFGLGEGSDDGRRLKAGEHLFVLLDDPSKANDCLTAVRRLAWCVGVGPLRRLDWAGKGWRSAGLRAGRRHRWFARASGLRGRGLAR